MSQENNSSVSVVLPVFNEEENIAAVVKDVISAVASQTAGFEIIAVDDGSSDGSVRALQRLAHELPGTLRVVSLASHEGYGAAVRAGIAAAANGWIFVMDADGQFRADDFVLLWNERASYSCVLGYRQRRRDPFFRRVLGGTGHFFARLLLGRNIYDINCGFKLFKAEPLKRLQCNATGGAIYFEILSKLQRQKGHRFRQLPVRHFKRIKGKATGGSLAVVGKIIKEGLSVLVRR